MSRGGRREGAGRKPYSVDERRRVMSVALSPALITAFQARATAIGESYSAFITRAIEERLAHTAGVRPDGDATAPEAE